MYNKIEEFYSDHKRIDHKQESSKSLFPDP